MTEITDVEEAAVRYWRGIGGKTNYDLASRILTARHREEHLRVYNELEGK